MRNNFFHSKGKIFLCGITAAVLLGMAFPAFGTDIPSDRRQLGAKICETLRKRVDLLLKLTGDYERQYKIGSLGERQVLDAQTELYAAKLLLMKAEAGRPAVPGIAVAFIRFYMASGYGKEMEKYYPQGQLALSSLLKAQLQANSAELDLLHMLQTQPYHADRLQKVLKNLRKPDPKVRLTDDFLRSLMEIEK